MKLDTYERKLLDSWEEVFKKGQLTLWIMLALKESPKHMTQIKQFIHQMTNGNLTADDQSVYRALRRYYDVEMVDFSQLPGKSGPDLKVYRLTDIGHKVLNKFMRRNIIRVFYKQEFKELIKEELKT